MKWFKALPFSAKYAVGSLEELKIWCKQTKRPVPEIDETSCGSTAVIGGCIFVVLFPKAHKTQMEFVDTVIHESVHVYQAVLQYAGEQQTGHELPAYLIASISTNLLKESNALLKGWKTGLQTGIPKIPQQS